jgi:signal transduction histidine kinase
MSAATVSGLGLGRIRRLVGAVLRNLWPATAGRSYALASIAAVARQPNGLDADAIFGTLASLVAAATGARQTQVWLAEPSGAMRRECAWPTGRVLSTRSRVAGLPELRQLADGGHVEPVGDAAGPLGALVLRVGARRGLTAVDLRLIADAANAVALLLRNRRLDADLEQALVREQEQALSLARSRHRVVMARDVARERLSSEIQRRVSHPLTVCASDVGALDTIRQGGPGMEDRRDEVLHRLTRRVDAAIADFREIVHGVFPATLADHGLAASVQNVAVRLPWPTSFRTANLPRLDQRVQTSVYFCLATMLGSLRDAQLTGTARFRVRRLDLELSCDGREPTPVLSAVMYVRMNPPPLPADGVARLLFDADTLDAIGDRVGAMEGALDVAASSEGFRLVLSVPVTRPDDAAIAHSERS